MMQNIFSIFKYIINYKDLCIYFKVKKSLKLIKNGT